MQEFLGTIILVINIIIAQNSYRKGCPQVTTKLLKSQLSSIEMVIGLVHSERHKYLNPVLDKATELFTICADVNRTNPESIVKSRLVDYDNSVAFPQKNELYLIYPLGSALKKRCPLSKYFIVIIRCPQYTTYPKEPIFTGKDSCDFVYTKFESNACFISAHVDFNMDEFKNTSIKEIKLDSYIIISFIILTCFLIISAIGVSIVVCLTDFQTPSDIDEIQPIIEEDKKTPYAKESPKTFQKLVSTSKSVSPKLEKREETNILNLIDTEEKIVSEFKSPIEQQNNIKLTPPQSDEKKIIEVIEPVDEQIPYEDDKELFEDRNIEDISEANDQIDEDMLTGNEEE